MFTWWISLIVYQHKCWGIKKNKKNNVKGQMSAAALVEIDSLFFKSENQRFFLGN